MRTPTATHLVALQKYRNMHGDHEATAIALGRLLPALGHVPSVRRLGICSASKNPAFASWGPCDAR